MNNTSIPFSQFPNNMNTHMQIVEPTYSQNIIKPPELNATFGRIPHRLVIDSRDRNHIYVDPNNYVIKLEQEYRDVISIDLVEACIPYSGYIINNNNNKFYFQESSDELLIAEVTYGDYTSGSDLATVLTNSLNLVGKSTYLVTADDNTRKFNITSNLSGGEHIFRMVFCGCECSDSNVCTLCRKKTSGQSYKNGSIGYKIGFDKANFLYARGAVISIDIISDTQIKITTCNGKLNEDFRTGDNISFENTFGLLYNVINVNGENEIVVEGTEEDIDTALEKLTNSKIYGSRYTSTGVWDLDDEKYIILDIREAELIEANNKNLSGKFATIIFNVPHGENYVLGAGRLPRRGIEKHYNPAFPKMDRLTIKFLTRDGSLYDFNGKEHVLVFDIITLNSPGKYNSFITT